MERAHRTFTSGRRIFLGDASRTGRLRLDALAQYLQDLATNDADDANLDHGRGWILRRMELNVLRLPTIYEDVELTTWCSGVGGRWAERSTQIADTRALDGGMCAVARAVWVYVNLDTGQPLSLAPSFFEVYGEDVKKHKVSARLQHPAPTPEATRSLMSTSPTSDPAEATTSPFSFTASIARARANTRFSTFSSRTHEPST